MDDGGTAVPPQYQGRGLHEPPKSRSRSRFRINLQRPLDLSSERGRVPQGKSGSIQSGQSPGSSLGAGDLLRRVLGRAGAGCSTSFRRRDRGLGVGLLSLSASVLTRTVERHSK